MKKLLCALPLLALSAVCAFAQIQTASEFFKTVSDYYTTLQDYEVTVDISAAGRAMHGQASYKSPELLRIDFTTPANQVFLFNGEELVIYLPSQAAILEQRVTGENAAVTPAGLTLLRRYYYIAYETGQAAVPLDEGSEQLVVNLLLTRRSAAEAFTSIRVSVDPEAKLIRRMVARTPAGATYTFNFSEYNLNVGIPAQRFQYDLPSDANSYNNFLFSE